MELFICVRRLLAIWRDMTPRAIRMPQEADLIVTEDTRHTFTAIKSFRY